MFNVLPPLPLHLLRNPPNFSMIAHSGCSDKSRVPSTAEVGRNCSKLECLIEQRAGLYTQEPCRVDFAGVGWVLASYGARKSLSRLCRTFLPSFVNLSHGVL